MKKGRIKTAIGATLVTGFLGGYILSDTIDRTVESIVHYDVGSIASCVQLGSPEYRLEGFRREAIRNPEEMSKYSGEFLEIAFMSGMDENGINTLYSYARIDLAQNPLQRENELTNIGQIAAQNFPDQVYNSLPDEKKTEYAKNELLDYIRENGSILTDKLGEVLYVIKTVFEGG